MNESRMSKPKNPTYRRRYTKGEDPGEGRNQATALQWYGLERPTLRQVEDLADLADLADLSFAYP